MNRLNRSVVIIRPLAPYLEWASRVSEDDFLDEEDAEVLASAYLLPDLDDEEDAEALLARCAQRIFESELAQWHADADMWPESRGFETMLQWFAIDMIPLVIDVGTEAITAITLEE